MNKDERLRIDKPDCFTAEDLRRLLEMSLPENMPLIAYPGETPIDVMHILDYMITRYEYRKCTLAELLAGSSYYWVEATPETGGSEGVYLHINLVTKGKGAPQRWPIITAKTLEEGPVAYAAMGMLGGVATDLIQKIININY